MGQTDGTQIIGSLLQTILAAETAHKERPASLVILLWSHIRDTMLRNDPHRMVQVFDDTCDT